MKRKLAALALLLAAVTLTGCGDERWESPNDRYDRLYTQCLDAGGSFEYNGSLPYYQCTMKP